MSCLDRAVWPASRGRDRGRPAGRAGHGSRPPRRARDRPACALAVARSRRTLPVPKDRTDEAMTQGIPVTYVPARNTVFLALALAWAETLGAFDIWIGVNCVDYSGYPDCRPEYLRAFEALANLATRAGVDRRRPVPDSRPALDPQQGRDHRAGTRTGRGLSH